MGRVDRPPGTPYTGRGPLSPRVGSGTLTPPVVGSPHGILGPSRPRPFMPTTPRSLSDRLGSFALLCLELSLVLAVVYQFEVEGQRHFLPVLALAAGGFAVHAWLPFRWRAWFFALLALGGL